MALASSLDQQNLQKKGLLGPHPTWPDTGEQPPCSALQPAVPLPPSYPGLQGEWGWDHLDHSPCSPLAATPV
jgi:hypothetical protein